MNGKEKCKILKEIRAQIAKNNDIEWIVSECKHQGDCLGTCPKCEAELRKLEKELEIKRNLGHVVAITGLSMMLAGCSVFEGILPPKDGGDVPNPDGDLAGDVEIVGEVEAPIDDDIEFDGDDIEEENIDTEMDLEEEGNE